VVDALNEAIVLQDNQGQLITCNKSAQSIFGDNFVGLKLTFRGGDALKKMETNSPMRMTLFKITMQTGQALHGVIMGLQRAGNPFTGFPSILNQFIIQKNRIGTRCSRYIFF
jgi:hypothetical protein